MSPKETSANALIVAQMRPALVQYFRRKCGTTEEAEDLAQDVLMRALARATWKSPEQAKGYIFRSAVNRWRDRRRMALTHGSTVAPDDVAAGILIEEIDPEHVLIGEQELNSVVTALLKLNERTRDVFLLIRLEQIKQATVAKMLGISLSTVEKELAKALVQLARCAR